MKKFEFFNLKMLNAFTKFKLSTINIKSNVYCITSSVPDHKIGQDIRNLEYEKIIGVRVCPFNSSLTKNEDGGALVLSPKMSFLFDRNECELKPDDFIEMPFGGGYGILYKIVGVKPIAVTQTNFWVANAVRSDLNLTDICIKSEKVVIDSGYVNLDLFLSYRKYYDWMSEKYPVFYRRYFNKRFYSLPLDNHTNFDVPFYTYVRECLFFFQKYTQDLSLEKLVFYNEDIKEQMVVDGSIIDIVKESTCLRKIEDKFSNYDRRIRCYNFSSDDITPSDFSIDTFVSDELIGFVDEDEADDILSYDVHSTIEFCIVLEYVNKKI